MWRVDSVANPDFTNKKKCISCTRQATKLCDIVIGVAIWAGHPPRYLTGGVHNPEVHTRYNLTCDKPICNECAIDLNEHMDICQECYVEIKKKAGAI